MASIVWLAFGKKGAAIVEVTDDDIDLYEDELDRHFPKRGRKPDEIIAATAIAISHHMACNPGGEVLTLEMHPTPEQYETLVFNRLMSLVELKQRNLI